MSEGNGVNVLFTSAGRRVELLRSFKQAYEELGLAGSIIAVDIDSLAPALRQADRSYIVPRVTDPAYIPRLAEICLRERIDLVFPLIDPDIPVLAEHRDEIEAGGTRLAVVPSRAATVTGDKWLTYQHFLRNSVPTPSSWIPDNGLEYQLGYPVFVKPRSGSAGANSFKARDHRELEFFLDYVTDPIVQDYLEGPEITSDVICDLDGKILAVICRQRIEVRWGEVAKGKTVRDPEIVDHCIDIAASLDAIGPITIQCMMSEGRPYFTEVNPRFAGGVPLAIAAGANAPLWFLALAAGLPIDVPALGDYETGLHITRFDDSIFITEQEHTRGTRSHI